MARSNSQPLPQNIEAEQAILGAILIDSHVINKVVEILVPDDFYKEAHEKIFQAMAEMYRENKPIDILTVFNYLKSKGQLLEDAGGSSYLTYLTEVVPTTVNVGYYAELVKEKGKERRLLLASWDVGDKLGNQGISSTEAIKQIRLAIEKEEARSDLPLKPASAKQLKDIEPVQGLWAELLYPSCITQVNSEPGVGKTTLFYNLCLYGALDLPFLDIGFSKILKVLYVDLETPAWLRKKKLETIYHKELPESLYFLDSVSIKRDFSPLLTLCRREKYDLVVFDTQSRAFDMEQENDNAEANCIMNLLRRLVKETNCAIVLIHHTPKSDGSKGAYRGRGASAIAGAVDVVVNLEALDDEIIKLTVGKNRVIGTNPVLYIKKAGEDTFEPYTPQGESSGFEMFKAQEFLLSLSPDREWQTGEIIKIGKEKGFNERTIERALKRLVEAGKYQRLKKGIYRIRQTDNSAMHRDGGCGGMAEATDQWDKEAKELEDLLSTMEANHAPLGSYS